MAKTRIHDPIVLDNGAVIEKVWRIKHIPSGAYFKPSRGFSTTEGRLAKTYSRKPSLSILPKNWSTGQIFISLIDKYAEPDEVKVVEYLITESGKQYDK